ncbi:MAG: HzsA-related protein [Planctomycetota bacterium]|jgi:hypothetical protein
MRRSAKVLSVFIAIVTPLTVCGSELYAAVSAITPDRIEADWLRQDEVRWSGPVPPKTKVKPEEDAPGGCDGIKSGQFGFHTEKEDRPWWQVDLGKVVSLHRVVVYSRCDLAEPPWRLMLLVSEHGRDPWQVYEHDGTPFFAHSGDKPVVVVLEGMQGRYVRVQLAGKGYLYLDEVEVYATGDGRNLALGKAATQSSSGERSTFSVNCGVHRIRRLIGRGLKLGESLRELGANVDEQLGTLRQVAGQIENPLDGDVEQAQRRMYLCAHRAVRQMALANPLLDFDKILFVKRAPGTLPHMSDQYYGWWSRPGGGIYLLEDFKSERPLIRCVTEGWAAGNFLRPELSYDGKKVLFAYCRYYPHVAGMEKVDKEKLPEDMFYHIFEMNVDGTGCRQLTFGRYDDFDGRYLPNGDIVFLSTRKGQSLQCGKDSAAATKRRTLPDSYVRCGGDEKRPVAVFTLHAMNADGSDLRAISAFENFEWTPSVADDGRILYARWDYIDRFNGHYMSLWSTNQDGTNPQLVYGNFTRRPQCIFEARSIPNSRKLVFTGSAHHSITGGSLALLDRTFGTEGEGPITRLTPEVCFPETEGWMEMYYANPYPLSENYYLVAWSDRKLPPHKGGNQIRDERNPANATGIYLYDRFGNLELLYRDPQISSMNPIAVRARRSPPIQPDNVEWEGPQQGCFLVQDVYQGLEGVERGSVTHLRIVGVPPKVQPRMNSPKLGVSKEDPGKFVLGTAPVEKDGSAYFRVPSGIPVFFQALDSEGLAIQTMRSLTYVQPNQTLSCVGCHESREQTPLLGARPIATLREPSKITPGPAGSWPLRFDKLVQPMLDRLCVQCHSPSSDNDKAAAFDLTAESAYENLISYGDKDLEKLAFEKDRSEIGQCPARMSKLLALLKREGGHEHVELDGDSFECLVTWMDTYAQRQGSFSPEQEQQLHQLKEEMASLLAQ